MGKRKSARQAAYERNLQRNLLSPFTRPLGLPVCPLHPHNYLSKSMNDIIRFPRPRNSQQRLHAPSLFGCRFHRYHKADRNFRKAHDSRYQTRTQQSETGPKHHTRFPQTFTARRTKGQRPHAHAYRIIAYTSHTPPRDRPYMMQGATRVLHHIRPNCALQATTRDLPYRMQGATSHCITHVQYSRYRPQHVTCHT